MMDRRSFLTRMGWITGGVMVSSPRQHLRLQAQTPAARSLPAHQPGEDIFAYLMRLRGRFDQRLYAQILGAASEFKEGDQALGVAAGDTRSRQTARALLSQTRLSDLDRHTIHPDPLWRFTQSSLDPETNRTTSRQTLGQLKEFLLTAAEADIQGIMPGLSSDVIASVVKLMTNDELIAVGQNVFNPLPGSQIGARGYLGARVQPNSPTDNLDDIRWQVFDAWAYAVGDVLLGTNPVSSQPRSVAVIEQALQQLLEVFEIQSLMPHCVLAHIDVQSEVEQTWPGRTALWFQSIGGTESANQTFDISVEKMRRYAAGRSGQYGLYFETGQGADFTNGHGHGFDMVMHEARKYGFARSLSKLVGQARAAAGLSRQPWVHLNDVAGFIGPEVFRSREQLVRCCLEDIAMGKLHGLCLGLDVCSTLHMDVSLEDLDWCLDQILPANPAYLMALPTKIDPMLGYLTTGYQDHVRLREKFGYRVNDPMWRFFQDLQVIDRQGRPTRHFGDPLWVYLQYRRKLRDPRPDADILNEGRGQMQQVRQRGVFLAAGHGQRHWDLTAALKTEIHQIYDDAKVSIWEQLDSKFLQQLPDRIDFHTQSKDREDYILHPTSGERPAQSSLETIDRLRQQHAGQYDVQIIISDGLNALAIMDDGHLKPFLNRLRQQLRQQGQRCAPEHIVVQSGRVRTGYRIGERLFGGLAGPRAICHVIGERPGTGHHTFSAYLTAPTGDVWGQAGQVDHNITKVVSGIAVTALAPELAATESAQLLADLMDA